MGETISDVFALVPTRPVARRRQVLCVAFQIDEPTALPSRHCIDDVEVIEIGRGPRSANRSTIEGKPALSIQVPDPMMSSPHARLTRQASSWRLDDQRSKNGSVVDGRLMRLGHVESGAVVQLGRTIFVCEDVPLRDGDPPDVQAVALASPRSDLPSLHASFADDVAKLASFAAHDLPTLVLGETGTGKELIAQALHTLSGRRGPLIPVNCGSIPPTLIESTLFGHKKGSFSGATADHLGHLRAANHGTLFLDEIGELSYAAQTALLRALQCREVVPVGESIPVPVDLRIVAATHRNMPDLIRQDRFREDLYARLGVIKIAVPPLRERRFDLGMLIGTLLHRVDASGGARVTPAAARALFAYPWPRNIRELENTLRSSRVRSGDGLIDLDHLPDEIAACGQVDEAGPPLVAPPATCTPADDELRAALVSALDHHGGNVTAAARMLGKHREQLHRWVRRFGIDLHSFRRAKP
jgi:sigma-54 dependent transcriptional regulator, acetoin dehydrogenase operon transcriptional activator AcoR